MLKQYEELLDMQIAQDNSIEGESTTQCHTCKNKGKIFIKKYNEEFDYYYEAIQECPDCSTKRKIMSAVKGANLDYEKYNLYNYQCQTTWQKEILDRAKKFIDVPCGFWYIGGQSGSGKTHICTSICLKLIKDQNRQVSVMNWRSDATQLKQVANDSSLYQPMIANYKKSEVLYIDDFFKCGEKPTSADINLAFEILNERYNDKSKITIISSEYYLDEIARFDNAIAGRIKERSFGNVFKIPRTVSYDMRQVV